MIKNNDSFHIFLITQKLFISFNFSTASASKKCASHSRRETANENKQFKETIT